MKKLLVYCVGLLIILALSLPAIAGVVDRADDDPNWNNNRNYDSGGGSGYNSEADQHMQNAQQYQQMGNTMNNAFDQIKDVLHEQNMKEQREEERRERREEERERARERREERERQNSNNTYNNANNQNRNSYQQGVTYNQGPDPAQVIQQVTAAQQDLNTRADEILVNSAPSGSGSSGLLIGPGSGEIDAFRQTSDTFQTTYGETEYLPQGSVWSDIYDSARSAFSWSGQSGGGGDEERVYNMDEIDSLQVGTGDMTPPSGYASSGGGYGTDQQDTGRGYTDTLLGIVSDYPWLGGGNLTNLVLDRVEQSVDEAGGN